MLVVEVADEPDFSASRPEVLFGGQYSTDGSPRARSYDVSRDGQRFLMVQEEQASASMDIHVVVNWSEELKRLAPTEN